MQRLCRSAIAALVLTTTGSVLAQSALPAGSPANPSVLASALLPGVQALTVYYGTPTAHHAYRVWLYVPDDARRPAPATGTATPPMPLLVLLDGNATFTLAMQAARLQQRLIGPVAIAAVAPLNDALFDEAARFHDFTTKAASGAWGVPRIGVPPHTAVDSRNASALPVPTGGADDFLHFLAGPVLAAIDTAVAIDPQRRTLFGHSLGGLFVLHSVLTSPCTFDRYVAASPSIWWNDGQLLRDLPHAAPATACGSRPLLLQAGGAEQHIAPDATQQRIDRVRRAAMLDNLHRFYDGLQDRETATLHVFPGGNHVSYLPAAISEAVAFAAAQQGGAAAKAVKRGDN